MEQPGASSTPTYVFIDDDGIVRWYLPFRLTEADSTDGSKRSWKDMMSKSVLRTT